jgi:PKD domain-containing protein
MRSLPLLLIAGALSLAAAPAASADTFCVHVQNCRATQKNTLQDALDAAAHTFGHDDVLVGDSAGPLVGPFTYPDGIIEVSNTVSIKAFEGTRPVLTAPVGSPVLSLSNGSLEGVDVRPEDASVGLDLFGAELRDVAVLGTGEIGIRSQGEDTLEGVETRGLKLGVLAQDSARLRIGHSRLGARRGALATRGLTTVTASTLQTTEAAGAGVQASGGGLSLDHVTVAGPGAAALEFTSVDIPGRANIASVALAGYARGIVRDTSQTGGEYPVAIRDSVWDDAHDVGGPFDESGNAHVDPRLGADLRLRGSSAAIDRDTLTDGRYRDVAGVATVGPRADAGAFEYRRRAPRIDAVDVPSAGGVDALLAFGATASDPDGDRLSVAWAFDDGAVATGERVAHAFARTGAHGVTLRVKDEAGLSATRTFAVAVAGDRTAPVLSAVRLSKLRATIQRARGLRLRFRVSEAARVRIVARGRAIVVAASPGRHSVALRRLKLRRPGRVAIAVSATDAAGNDSRERVVHLRLRR